LSQDLPAIAAPRQFKAAERRQLQEMIEKSFALDPGWNAALHMIDAQVKSSIAAAFNSESASWLALQHGRPHRRRYSVHERS